MCRFVAYYGAPISMAALITEPENSLIHQSFQSRERDEPLNGDGFGMSWYEPEVSATPGLFRSVSPAWNNRNLHELARMTVSPCIFGHVRAASEGSSVMEPNCHPFVHRRFAFMHNGELGGFRAIRRRILDQLSDEAFEMIQGTTDSEHVFALFLDILRTRREADEVEATAAAIRETVVRCSALVAEHAPGGECYLNLAVANGSGLVVSRYSSRPGAAESLHVHAGHRYRCEAGVSRLEHPGDGPGAVIVSSEPLSADPGWEVVPEGHLVLVRGDDRAEFRPLAADP